MTEPVPDVLDELGWTGGEAINDCRTLLHYFRTTRDGRIAFGWGGGRLGLGSRHRDVLELDSGRDRHGGRQISCASSRSSPDAASPTPGVGRSTSPLRICRSSGAAARIHHGFGFTGNGVGPCYLGGEILARLALDRRDELTRLALVEPDRKLMPPEPLRWAGGSLIRAALVRKDAAEDAGRTPDPVTSVVASLPRRLGLHLPR